MSVLKTEMAAAINSLVNEETEVNYKSIHTFDQALRDIAVSERNSRQSMISYQYTVRF